MGGGFCYAQGQRDGIWGYWRVDFDEPQCMTSWGGPWDKVRKAPCMDDPHSSLALFCRDASARVFAYVQMPAVLLNIY